MDIDKEKEDQGRTVVQAAIEQSFLDISLCALGTCERVRTPIEFKDDVLESQGQMARRTGRVTRSLSKRLEMKKRKIFVDVRSSDE